MQGLSFLPANHSRFQVLCLGAHSDDIEIGCGGTLLRFLAERPDTEVVWIVLGAAGERAREAEASAKFFLRDAGHGEIIVKDFRDGFFPYCGGDIKEFLERLKRQYSPDLILTHYRHDLHQDHRLVSELTWNIFRNHLILEYEIPKYDGDLGVPNLFVPLSESVARSKVDTIVDCFHSQREKTWFTADTFYSLMRLRGLESNAPAKYAEAYYARKVVL
jgi:LmbE family N-acetylglucosaminyl deacetylase